MWPSPLVADADHAWGKRGLLQRNPQLLLHHPVGSDGSVECSGDTPVCSPCSHVFSLWPRPSSTDLLSISFPFSSFFFCGPFCSSLEVLAIPSLASFLVWSKCGDNGVGSLVANSRFLDYGTGEPNQCLGIPNFLLLAGGALFAIVMIVAALILRTAFSPGRGVYPDSFAIPSFFVLHPHPHPCTWTHNERQTSQSLTPTATHSRMRSFVALARKEDGKRMTGPLCCFSFPLTLNRFCHVLVRPLVESCGSHHPGRQSSETFHYSSVPLPLSTSPVFPCLIPCPQAPMPPFLALVPVYAERCVSDTFVSCLPHPLSRLPCSLSCLIFNNDHALVFHFQFLLSATPTFLSFTYPPCFPLPLFLPSTFTFYSCLPLPLPLLVFHFLLLSTPTLLSSTSLPLSGPQVILVTLTMVLESRVAVGVAGIFSGVGVLIYVGWSVSYKAPLVCIIDVPSPLLCVMDLFPRQTVCLVLLVTISISFFSFQ